MTVTTDPASSLPVSVAPPTVRVGGSKSRTAFALAIIAIALGFVLFKGLGNATLYFRTAKEAVDQRASLGTRRFRIEGVVLPGSVKPVGETVHFTIEQDGVDVAVVHQGDPPELFKPDRDVVLEGRFSPGAPASSAPVFESDRIMIKHSNQYVQKNPNRVKDYIGKPAS